MAALPFQAPKPASPHPPTLLPSPLPKITLVDKADVQAEYLLKPLSSLRPQFSPLRRYLRMLTQLTSPAIHKNKAKAVLRIRAYCLGFGYVFRPFRAPSRIFSIHDAGGCD
jgi:hypothetical protein